jgi:hypothetical protein
MKRIFIILIAALMITAVIESCKKTKSVKGCKDADAQNFNASATEDDGTCQYLASSSASNSNAVLEEYTGVRCTYCPDGHRKAQAFSDANPGRVVLINVHTGIYATPSAGWPDFTTMFGDALAGMSSLTGFPAGSMNRHIFTGNANAGPYYKMTNTSMALGRSGFAPAGGNIMTMPSPVNMGIKSSFDAGTRTLTVWSESYFTGDVAGGALVNVALLENNVIGKQIDAGVYNDNYVHKHMLRYLLAGQYGEMIPDADAKTGKRIVKKYTYTVPSTINMDNCDVATFITKPDHTEIMTGVQVKAK